MQRILSDLEEQEIRVRTQNMDAAEVAVACEEIPTAALMNELARRVKKWLDVQVDVLTLRRDTAEFNSSIRTYRPDKNVLVANIHEVAEIMGFELTEEKVAVSDFLYEYSFMYRGVKFYDYREERMESFAVSD